MASNRPAPHAPSAYGLGGPADFGGPVGFGGPAGFTVPSTVGDPAGVPAPTAVSGPDDVSAFPAVGGPTDDPAPAGAPQVPSLYGQFPGQRPPGEVFSHDLLTPEPPPPGAPGGAEPSAGPAGDGWPPADESDAGDASARPVRGKHRVAKQRSGGLARGGTVLGVGVIAAVGASGVAAAEDRPPVPISVPDPGGVVDDATGALQDAGPRAADAGAAPVATPTGTDSATEGSAPSVGPAASRPQGDDATAGGAPGAGPAEALRHRILQQADGRPGATEAETGSDADAGPDAARDAGPDAGPADEAAPDAASDAASGTASDAAAEPAAPASPARPAASDDRPADGAGTAVAPVSSYTLTTGFGQAGDRWAADHTGQDFTAPTGTLVRAVHDGTLTQAGWAGGYGYRIVLTLDDGTQLWFCHLSSMVKTTGRVHAGDVIGRVGATGNATTPHLHLEVRPDAGAPTDPLPWLRDRGVTV
ncbi:peptidoglycan DD-metalloendopeptidase family protein [Streptomyces noursei]|uniref:peptidoglycan DD-metalloendopeptidase family protein n=1 Tax=Streptomyces noursei TaxID=1971 RepID=UPI0037532C5F